MRKYFTVMASFVIMLCIGSVYGWSIIASELIANYNFSAAQSQIIFGALIAIFPATMIFVGQLGVKIKARILGYVSGVFFLLGYLAAGFSQGSFLIVLMGIGVLGGIATGFGYWAALTTPVQWFPTKKGLITGIAAAGFGLGAVFMSELAENLLSNGKNVLQVLSFIGVLYGSLIIVLSNFIVQKTPTHAHEKIKISGFIKSPIFYKLFTGIFLGTFAGLLIIGSLKIIGDQSNIPLPILVLGVSLFAVANFAGRLSWGFLSDFIGASLTIFMALMVQAVAIILLNIVDMTETSYLALSLLIGFGFGGNFVLFAKETANVFGIKNLGIVYPYVFLGYAIAGIAGPFSGGLMFDISGSYTYAILLASIMSFAGSLLFLFQFFYLRKNEPVRPN